MANPTMTTLFRQARRAVGAAALVLLASCGGGGGGDAAADGETPVVLGQPGPGDPDNWMPLAVAHRWVFRGRTSGVGGERQYTNFVEVTGVGSVGGRSTLRLRENNFGGSAAVSVADVVNDNNGIAVLALEGDDALPAGLLPFWELRYPLTAGSRFVQRDRRDVDFGSDLDGDGRNETASLRSEVTVVGTEAITVPVGSFASALRVDRRTTLAVRLSRDGSSINGTENASAWYVKGVGWVRRSQTATANGLTTTVDEVLEAYFASSGNAGIDPVSGPTANGTLPAGGVVTHSWFPQAQGRYTVTLSALSADAELVIPAAPQCERGSGARSATAPEDCTFTHDGLGPVLAQVRGSAGAHYALTLAPAVTFANPQDESSLVVVSTPAFGQVGARGTSTYQVNGLPTSGRFSIAIAGLDADADLTVYSDATYSFPLCGLVGVGDTGTLPEECVVDVALGNLYFQVRAGELNTTGASYQVIVQPVP